MPRQLAEFQKVPGWTKTFQRHNIRMTLGNIEHVRLKFNTERSRAGCGLSFLLKSLGAHEPFLRLPSNQADSNLQYEQFLRPNLSWFQTPKVFGKTRQRQIRAWKPQKNDG